jgi:hypothetical protein
MEPIRMGTKMTCPTCGVSFVVIKAPTGAVSCCGVTLSPDSAKEGGHAKPVG